MDRVTEVVLVLVVAVIPIYIFVFVVTDVASAKDQAPAQIHTDGRLFITLKSSPISAPG